MSTISRRRAARAAPRIDGSTRATASLEREGVPAAGQRRRVDEVARATGRQTSRAEHALGGHRERETRHQREEPVAQTQWRRASTTRYRCSVGDFSARRPQRVPSRAAGVARGRRRWRARRRWVRCFRISCSSDRRPAASKMAPRALICGASPRVFGGVSSSRDSSKSSDEGRSSRCANSTAPTASGSISSKRRPWRSCD